MGRRGCFVSAILLLAAIANSAITGDDLRGKFKALSGPDSCPMIIKHKSVTKLDKMRYYIYYENILHDNQVCKGDDFLTLIYRGATPSRGSKVDTVSHKIYFAVRTIVGDSTKNKGDMILDELTNQGIPFYFGHSLNSKKCGDIAIPQNTYFFFVEPNAALALPGVSLHPGKKYMIMQGKNDESPCVYANTKLPSYSR